MWFWDAVWDEHLGYLNMAEPSVGDTIRYGFIRYRPDTEWIVTDKREGRVYVEMRTGGGAV